MSDRKFKIVIVDDSKAFLELARANIEDSSAFHDMDYEVVYYHAEGKSAEQIVGDLRLLRPDELVIDHSLGLTTGKRVVDKYREERKIPVVYASNYSLEQLIEQGVMGESMIEDSLTGLEEKSIDGFLNKAKVSTSDIGQIIRKYAFKEIDLSLESVGKFNARLIEESLVSPSIKTIKFHSSSKERDDIFAWAEESEDLESADISKLIWCPRLEDMLDTDILAIASVSISPEEMQKIEYSNDRKEFFPYEYPNFLTKFKSIKQTNPRIPVMIYSNPVDHLLEFGRRLGLNDEKLFSPNQPDTARLIKAIRYYLGPEKADAFIRESEIIAAGLHGDEKGVYSLKPNSPLIEFVNIVKMAEKRANEMGKKSQRAAIKLGLPYFLPQKTNFPTFEDLAHYRPFQITCHTYWDFTWPLIGGKRYRGYAAGPVTTSFKGGFSVRRDERAVEKIGYEEFYCAICESIESERLYLNNRLGPRLTVAA